MNNSNSPNPNVNLSAWATAAAFFLAPPNALLTAIFFFSLIGSLSYIFGLEVGMAVSVLACIFLGVGFVLGETVGHIRSKLEGKTGTALFLIMMAIAATNWGAGVFRSADYARAQGVEAKAEITNNPRYQELSKEKDYLEAHVLNDGFVGNDESAINRMGEISREMETIEKEYSKDASLLNGSGKWNAIISIAFIVINIVYGMVVRAAVDVSPIARKEKKQGLFQKAGQLAHQKLDTALEGGSTRPKVQPTTAEYKEYGFTPPSKEPEKKMPVNITSFSANGSAERKNKRELRKQKLINFLQKKPDATVQEMCDAIGVNSRTTVLSYLEELNIK